MNKTLRYLHHPASQPCRAAMQYMLENNISFQEEVIDITSNITERPEFREMYNPTGQIPILVDGDFVIWESAAIVHYLHEKFSCPDFWLGSDIRQRGLIQQFINWYGYTLRLGGGAFHWTIFAPMIYGYDKDFSAEIKRGRYLLYEALDVLESFWLKGRAFLCGDRISYPDIVAAQDLISHHAGRIVPDEVWERHPGVKTWFDKIAERPYTKLVSEWLYELMNKILEEGLRLNFKRKTALLKGTELAGGHNHGIIYAGDDESYLNNG